MREEKKIWLQLLLLINPILIDLNAQTVNRHAIVIDEIMADPSPAIGLPNQEFIELKNVSSLPIDLFHWKITDGTSHATISISYVLQPDSFVVLCPASALAAFAAFGGAIGLTSFPSLNNDKDLISLISNEGRIIHAVEYQLNWIKNAVKAEGGWTLEMIDTGNPCSGELNWKASIDPRGGTPAMRNSVEAINPDQNPPAFIRTYLLDSLTIVAVFDESLDSNEAAITAHYLIEEIPATPVEVTVLPPLFKEVRLRFEKSLPTGNIYHLVVSQVKDCNNNTVGLMNRCPVGRPEQVDALDLVINEILFNPKSDGVDYVELFNRSKKVIDVAGIFIATRSSGGLIGSIKKISEIPFLVFPGDYIIVTESIEKLKQQFLVKNGQYVIELNSLPSFPDDNGNVIILDVQGNSIDELTYDEDWHFALLSSREGIALERIEPGSPTQSRENWTSAASTVGYGTPSYQNSQYKAMHNSNGGITIQPPIFSPDNDGLDDICFIQYQMIEPNYVANVYIFDVSGKLIRRLYKNATLAQQGYLTWDGMGEGGQRLPVGIYIIYAEVFNLSGNAKKFKQAVTLARKF